MHLMPLIVFDIDVLYLFSDEKIDELKVIFLEEEIKDLKSSLREAQNRNAYLTQVLEQEQSKRSQ